MCFIVGKNTEVRTAKKNIVCWKYGLDGVKTFISLHRGFKYKKVKLYKRDCLKKNRYEEGIGLSIGFHSFNRNRNGTYTKFIIPKGTRYLYNLYYKERISNQIIMI